MKNKEVFKTVGKIVTALALLIIMYLFALNGRYSRADNAVIDKWKRQVYVMGSDELPVIKNGKQK